MAWPRDAYVGQNVVCIDDRFDSFIRHGENIIPHRLPMLNEVLTISNIRLGDGTGEIPGLIDAVYLGFEEIDLWQTSGPIGGDCRFAATCFKPLIRRSTEAGMTTLRSLLNPIPIRKHETAGGE